MTPAEETRLQGVEERAKIVADSHFEHAEWTIKQFQRVRDEIFVMAVAQVLEGILILLLLAHALKGG